MTAGSRAAHRRIWVAALGTLATVAVLLVGQGITAVPASAHNALVRTVPANGAIVGQVPGAIRLVFNEPALKLGTQILVTGPNGRVDQGEVQLVDTEVRQAIGPNAPAGHYTVRWRVTSDDGHPVTGEFGFTADAAGGGPAIHATAAPVSTNAESTTAATRSTVWITIAVIVGAAIAVGLVLLTRRRRATR